MANYEYIISSLPVLCRDWKASQGLDIEGTLAFIRSQLSASDVLLLDQVLSGFDEASLDERFYRIALGERPRRKDVFAANEQEPLPKVNAFVKGYFAFDLRVRNEKVRFLNKALGRPLEQDIFLECEGEFPEREKVQAVLAQGDILARERGLDEVMWDKAVGLATFHYFDIDALLGFVVRLKIIHRWLRLDEKTGQELFRRLVQEVRGTFKGVEFTDN
ncbi:MAG: DUF2764 family protein [Bacteroidales bacterium]|nr:DUF2764 family protein [Bacteroidales bacterium]